MKKFWHIFRHEYFRHVLRWRFVMALLSVPLYLVFMGAMMVFALMSQIDRTPLGYVDQSGLIINQTLPDALDLPFLYPPLRAFASEDEARAALADKKLQAYYVLPPDFEQTRAARLVYKEKEPSGLATGQFVQLVQLNLLAGLPEAVALRVTDGASMTFQTVGERPAAVAVHGDEEGSQTAGTGEAVNPPAGSTDSTSKDAPFPFTTVVPGSEAAALPDGPVTGSADDDAAEGASGFREMIKMAAPIAAAVFLFSAVLTSSGYLMQAVVDEKENRTMEILATSASPATIMNGKISALICVGLTQMLFWAGPPIGLLAFAKASLPALPVPEMEGGMILLLLGTVLPTFVMVSGLMATVGVSVTEAREGQQVMSLFNLLLMTPFILAVSILARPDGPIALALSFFPLTASLTLLMRASFSTVPVWQMAVSITVLFLSAVGALWLSGRVFRLGMLSYGRRLGWREVFRAAKKGGAQIRAAAPARADERPK